VTGRSVAVRHREQLNKYFLHQLVSRARATPERADTRVRQHCTDNPAILPSFLARFVTLWTEGIGMTSRLLGWATTVALLVVASTAYAQTTYTTIDTPASLYNPGAVYSPYALYGASATSNTAGEIVGSYIDRNGQNHGFIYGDGAFTSIDFPDGMDIVPTSVNDQGDAVGSYCRSDGRAHGFLYRPARTQPSIRLECAAQQAALAAYRWHKEHPR
jgi:hypothetical protein